MANAEPMSPVAPDPTGDDHKYYITAAIDFGTTFSCYAFSFNYGTRQGEIIYNKNWGGRLNTESLKTPTFVLTDPVHKFHSFGYDAISHYKSLSQEERMKYNMYSNYKEALHATQSFYGPATIKSSTGYERPAKDIFVMGLKYLKDHMLLAIKGEVPTIENHDIQWVLCSPAIWSAPAKQFIRNVAKEVGLTKELLSSQLLLALEPEAAAIFCRSVEMNHFTRGPQQLDMTAGDQPSFRFTTDTKFVLIDAGGGTVDITAYRLKDKGSLEELYPPSGGAWGGVRVDQNFLELICELFSQEFVSKFQTEYPGPSLEMLINFQRAKLDIKTEENTPIKIPIPTSLDRAYRKRFNQEIDEAIQEKNLGVIYEEGSMVIPFQVAKTRLFDPPVKKIVTHVTKMLEHGKLQKLDYIMLVGGFGQSDILQKAVFDAFHRKAKVLLPLEAQVAVIRGAVRFGQDPSQVNSRVAGLTYGEDIYMPFDPAKHDPSRKKMIEGKAYCRDCFQIYVKKGESIDVGEVRKFISCPIYAAQKKIRKKLFSIDKENPSFIDEEGANLVGELNLAIPDTARGKDRQIQSLVRFGGTELVVEVTELTREGSEVKTEKMDFLVY